MSAVRFLVAAAVLATFSTGANAVVVTFASDTAWNDATGVGDLYAFTKLGGVSLRAGNRGAGGDWELGVVNPADAPIVQGQQAWAGSNSLVPNGSLGFANYDAAGVATLAYKLDGTGRSLATGIGAGANSLWIRARTNGGDLTTAAVLNGLVLNFTGGGSIVLGDLVGDGNAEYIGVIDPRVAGGFSLGFDSATFAPRTTGGSGVMLQVKIGNTPVIPEPATWAMMIAGFGLVGGALRRRQTVAAA
jgi:hypothetical protein